MLINTEANFISVFYFSKRNFYFLLASSSERVIEIEFDKNDKDDQLVYREL